MARLQHDHPCSADAVLRGHSILLVEDEPLVALELHAALSRAGASIIAATSLRDAEELCRMADISAAVLDVNLGATDCASICRMLARRRIPFMFYTGLRHAALCEHWPDAPVLAKPSHGQQIVDLIRGNLLQLH